MVLQTGTGAAKALSRTSRSAGLMRNRLRCSCGLCLHSSSPAGTGLASCPGSYRPLHSDHRHDEEDSARRADADLRGGAPSGVATGPHARHKLGMISKKDAGSRRAKHIARNNLGTKKQRAGLRRARAALRTISGAAVKEVIYGEGHRTRKCGKVAQSPDQRPRTLVVEDLSHLRGKAKSKKISRACSSWARTENERRTTVHAYVGGSDVETANAAYTSQTCPDPTCGYVHKDNRHGDTFHCRNPSLECDWQGDADHGAATNLMTRTDDREISRFTPYTEVKKILEARFLRRMETRTGGQRVSPREQHSSGETTDKTGVRALSDEQTATAHGGPQANHSQTSWWREAATLRLV